MHTYAYIYIYIYIYTYTYIHMYIYMYIWIYMHTWIYVFINMYILFDAPPFFPSDPPLPISISLSCSCSRSSSLSHPFALSLTHTTDPLGSSSMRSVLSANGSGGKSAYKGARGASRRTVTSRRHSPSRLADPSSLPAGFFLFQESQKCAHFSAYFKNC